METPCDIIRNELRHLVLQEFSLREEELLPRIQQSSPLHDSVFQQLTRMGFKLPNMEPYDGTLDPNEHIDHYRAIIHIQ